MKTVNKTAGGLNYDDSGFLVGKRRLEQNVRSIEQDTKKIITLLESQLQARQANPPAHQLTSFQKAIIEANRRVTIDAVDQLIASNNRQPRGQTHPKPTIDSDSLGQHSTPRPDQSPSAPNSGSQPLPNRSRFPNRRTLDTDNPADVRDLGQQQRRNAINQQRDAKGRFGNGAGSSGSNESAALNKISDRLKDSLKEIHVPQGVDPTVNAVNELGAVLKPAGVLFKRGKRNEPLSRDEEKHNREVIKQLRRIGANSGSGGNAGMLAMLRFLPLMIGAIVAAIGAAAAAAFGMGGGNAINEQLGKTETGRKIQDTFGKVTARTLAWFGNKDAQEAVAANDKAEDAERYKDRPENPAWYSNDGVKRFARKFGIDGWLKEDEPVAGKPASDGKAVGRIAEGGAGKYAPLLDEIASGESKGGAFGTSGYDAIYSGAKVKPSKPISQMTVGEVKAYQQQLIKAGSKSTAVGRYQFIKNKGNFAKMAAQAGLKDSDIFDNAAQDKLAVHYAGGEEQLDQWIKTGNHKALTNKIAEQWASQKNTRGVGNYDGDGLNKARHGGLKVIRKINEQILDNESTTQSPSSSYNRLSTNPAKPTQKVAVIPLQPTSARSVPQLAPVQPIPAVKDQLTSKPPQIVQLASSSDNIGQNVSDRDIAHSVTGGLGARTWDA